MKALWTLLVFFWFALSIDIAEAQTYQKMTTAETQTFMEKAVIAYNYQCFYICEGTKIPVKKWRDGKYHTADGTVIEDSRVTCIGKPVDKVATANSTANRAERKADKALATSDRAQAMADSAMTIALQALACCRDNDQLDSLEQIVQQLLRENGQFATELGILSNEMPEDQSEAVQELQGRVSDLEDKDQMFEAFARSTHKPTWENIVDRAQEAKEAKKHQRPSRR